MTSAVVAAEALFRLGWRLTSGLAEMSDLESHTEVMMMLNPFSSVHQNPNSQAKGQRMRSPVWGLGLLLSLVLASCGGSTSSDVLNEDDEQPLVVASYSVLCDLVGQIAEDTVNLQCLIDFDRDPHTYEGTPSDRRAIEQADASFYAGLNFEPSIIQMVETTNSDGLKTPVHELAAIDLIEVSENGSPIVADPHIWHDVENGIAMVIVIGDTLSQLSPDNAELYSEKVEDLTTELQQLDTWVTEQIQTIPIGNRQIITTHDAMAYYAQAYDLAVAGTLLGLSPEDEPTAARVRELVETIRASGIPTVFAELTTNDRVLRTVADEAGVDISEDVLIADGIGAEGTVSGSYQGMIQYNTCTIVTGLGGTCSPFTLIEE